MAPRKSTASTGPATSTSPNGAGDTSILSTATAATTEPKSPSAHKNRSSTAHEADGERNEKKKHKAEDLGIDDLLLPRTLTSRLSRGTLPPNTSIQRDALLALTKSATVFISYLAHNANNLTSRKTIQSQDILEALRETELWNVPGGGGGMTLGERVRAEVERWEGEVRGKRKGYRERVKARESGVSVAEGNEEEGEEEEGRRPAMKKARRGSEEEEDLGVDGEEDAAAAQLRAEGHEAVNGDGTETDPDVADEDGDGDEDDQEEGEDEEQDEQDEEEEEDEDGGPGDREQDLRRGVALAPNGRIEVGSDEESD